MKHAIFLFLSLSFCCLIFNGCASQGCTDPTASNYQVDAEQDDGSCCYDGFCDIDCPASYRTGCLCNDGTTSNSTGSGACSGHGGVYCWYCNCY